MSPAPMYQKIYEDLTSQITSGRLPPEDRLPSEMELAEQYGVSRMTVRQAIDLLSEDRLLVRRKGAGTFVTHPGARYRRLNRLTTFAEEIGARGRDVHGRIHFQGTVHPPDEVAERLGVKPRQDVVRLVRVRVIDRIPAALQESWLPYGVAAVIAREPLTNGSLYQTLRERCGLRLRWAEQSVSASAATQEQAECLEVDPGSPLIASSRETYADLVDPVEFVRSWTRPEFPLSIRLDP